MCFPKNVMTSHVSTSGNKKSFPNENISRASDDFLFPYFLISLFLDFLLNDFLFPNKKSFPNESISRASTECLTPFSIPSFVLLKIFPRLDQALGAMLRSPCPIYGIIWARWGISRFSTECLTPFSISSSECLKRKRAYVYTERGPMYTRTHARTCMLCSAHKRCVWMGVGMHMYMHAYIFVCYMYVI